MSRPFPQSPLSPTTASSPQRSQPLSPFSTAHSPKVHSPPGRPARLADASSPQWPPRSGGPPWFLRANSRVSDPGGTRFSAEVRRALKQLAGGAAYAISAFRREHGAEAGLGAEQPPHWLMQRGWSAGPSRSQVHSGVAGRVSRNAGN